ncbi:TPA: hypothetical protein ACIEVS_000967 [Streptococcus pyogenes]
MKTKSKRFLNLATLCLALLGTTLLMTRPVKAEVSLVRGTQQTVENAEDSDAKIEKEYLERYGLNKLEGQYYIDRFRGYLNGHKDGLKGSKRPKPGDIPIPSDFQGDRQDYKDGYEEGFAEGRYKRRPLETEAEDDSQEEEGRQEGRQEGSQEGSQTPEDSQRSEERQGESGNQQGDMLTPIVDAIVDAIFEAWDYVLSWFK